VAAHSRNHALGLILAVLLALGIARPTPAATDTLGIKPLPSKQIETVYRNGDLDSVVIYIRMGRPKPMFLDKGDSVVAFKYLGIIYSADPKTREKGRYYFNQLLMKDPRASITELLPGENARMTFKEVREEFFELYPHLVPQGGLSAAPPAEEERTDTLVVALRSGSGQRPAPAAQAQPARKRNWTWAWITGGVIVAGGAAAVALLDPPAKTYTLND
jgi:hypothetical protein